MTEQPALQVATHRPGLDGLRGLAAYIVVLSHVSNETGLWNRLFGVGGGQIGVMLFFALSGYLMGALYLDRPFTREQAWAYGVHRVSRVLPLYYIVLTLALALSIISLLGGVDVTIFPIAPTNFLLHYGLISGESVFWTIPIEIHFYLAFVCLWWLYTKSRAALFIVTAIAIAGYFFIPMDADKLYHTLIFTGAFFLSGLLISRVHSLNEPPSTRSLWSAGLAGFFVLALLLFPNIYHALFGGKRWLLQAHVLQMWHDPLYLVVISGCLFAALSSRLTNRVLGTRFMVHSGRISYSIYLLHLPVIIWLDRLTTARVIPELFLALTFVITIGLAGLSHRFVEQPARRMINVRFAARAPRAHVGKPEGRAPLSELAAARSGSRDTARQAAAIPVDHTV